MKAIKTIIVDNNPYFSVDLKLILESEFSADVIAVIDCEEALYGYQDSKVDIIFLNLIIARKNSFQNIKRFLWENSQMKVIGINTFLSEPNYLFQLIEVGMKGCIDGNNIYSELTEALTKVLNGGSYFSSRLIDAFKS